MRNLLIPFILLFSLFVQEQPFVYEGQTMGTFYKVHYYAEKEILTQQEIDSLLEEINRQMSTYREDSEISQVNKAPLFKDLVISKEFSEVLKKALIVMKEFPLSYDITLGDQINAYGFGPKKIEKKNYLRLDPLKKFSIKDQAIRKLHASCQLDLSSIAKGYALDLIASKMKDLNIKNFLIEIGGEVKVQGKNQKRDWKIAIENPLGKLKFVFLKNESIATSGIYKNFYEENSYTYTHIFSPKTGQPIHNDIYSLSIIHKEAAYADAYSTALMPLSKKDLMRALEEKNLKAFVIFKDGTTIERL